MSRRPRTVLLLATLTLFALVAAACGGDADGTAEQAEAPATGVEPGEPEADDPTAGDPTGEPDGEPETDDEIARFYADNDVVIRVGLGEGGPTDTVARLVGRHLGKHIPGNPRVVVENHPGAGSMLNFNQVYGQGPFDGTVIAVPQRQLPLSELLGAEGVEFVSTEFSWLGGYGEAIGVVAARTDVAETFEDAQEREVVVAGSGPGAASVDTPMLLNAVAGTQFTIVTGYDGVSDTGLAVERGEADAFALQTNGLFADYSDWLDSGFATALIQVSRNVDDRLPEVPNVYDYLETDEQRAVMDLYTAPMALGYAHAAPPGVPPERLAALRDAYRAVFDDPEFHADAEQVGMTELGTFLSGEEIDGIVAGLFETPDDIVELFKTYLEVD